MQRLLENLPHRAIGPLGRRPKILLNSIPETPGIYVYFKDNTIIYIGKAINLKRRIASYFDLDLELKTARMIAEANFISYIQVDSELSALLLEASLIRKYMPHYNIAAKDDKHPLYIAITKELYPRVLAVRKTMLENLPVLASYGPFPSSGNVRSVLRLLRRTFHFSDHKLGKRACLYSHIGLCSPCPSQIEELQDEVERKPQRKIYLQNIKNIKQILDGQIAKVTKNLDRDMRSASNKQNYEAAAHLRNQITQLEYITRPQLPTDFYLQNPNLYEDQRKKELDSLFSLISNFKFQTSNLRRIECFDIAHLAGTNATASMVTFIDGEAEKKYYRHFKIKKAKGGDDYGSMEEVARRRALHSDWGMPDLIIVDGGLGQVKAFTSILYSNKVKIPVVGVAKHPDRLIIIPDTSDKPEKSDTSERLERSDKPDKKIAQKILLTGPALNLVSRMRDEAHRFARRYHHGLISKSIKNANST